MNDVNPRGIIQTIPMFRCAVLLIGGIVLGDVMPIRAREWLLLLSALIGMALLCYRKFSNACNILILASVIAIGGFRISFNQGDEKQIKEPDSITAQSIWEEYAVRGTECEIAILSEPRISGKTIQFDGYIHKGSDAEGKKVRVSLLRDTIDGRYKTLHVGDGIRCLADFSPLKQWYRMNSNFDYIRWLRSQGFVCRVFVGINKWEKEEIGWRELPWSETLKLKAMSVRQAVINHIKPRGIDEESFAVATAMALGYKQGLTTRLKEEYSMVGASHILALSGMHLSIIVTLLAFITGRERKRERLALLCMIWIYVLFVGMPTSVTRAATMLSIYELTDMAGRGQRQLNVIGFTALAMAAWNPLCIWDVGFQMSFIAVLSIILMNRIITDYVPEKWRKGSKKDEKRLSKYVRRKKTCLRMAWYTGAVSLVAQIGTMPLTTYYFGRVTFYFILTNLVVIPASMIIVSVMLVLTMTALIDIAVGGVLQGLIFFAMKVLSYLIMLQNWLLKGIASLPGASIEGIEINTAQTIALYAIICAIMVWINRDTIKKG